MALLTSDIFARKFLGVSIKEIKDDLDDINTHYNDVINDVREKFSQTLEKSIENDGKVIIFIDDLDRCENQNILSILGNIKQMLNVEKLIFVLGIDMKKIENAWTVDHKGNSIQISEAKEHVDKLFQLKIKIPLKRHPDFIDFARKTCPMLPEKEINLFARSVRRNPRKLKHALNLYYFALSIYRKKIQNHDDHAEELTDKLDAIAFAVILHSAHPKIMESTIGNFTELLKAAKIIAIIERFDLLKKNMIDIQQLYLEHNKPTKDIIIYGHNRRYGITREYLNPTLMDLLNIVENDWESFNFLKSVSRFLELNK